MTIFRIAAGVLFLAWFGCVIRVGWLATRSLPDPEDWYSKYGKLDPNSDEFRRLILK